MLLAKNLQYLSDFADILAILSTHELIILIKFDEDWTKIVNFLLELYFWSIIIFFNQSLVWFLVERYQRNKSFLSTNKTDNPLVQADR